MSQTTKGKCPCTKHKMVEKIDGDGRVFKTCEICGVLPVIINRK